MHTSVFAAALLVLLACQSTLGQWSSFNIAVGGGISSVTQLQQLSNSQDLFALCNSEGSSNLRQLCRISVPSQNTWRIYSVLPLNTIRNFAALASGTDLFFTGGLASPVVDSSNNGVVTSSYMYQPSSHNITFAPQYFGTVVASAIDVLQINQIPVLAQYHLAYTVNGTSNAFTWLVQRVVSQRSDLDHTWTINDVIPSNCSTQFTLGTVYTTISPLNNDSSKVLSIGLVGSSRGCSGLYQFLLPTLTANDLVLRRIQPFASTAMTIYNDYMFYSLNTQLCRINLVDVEGPQCVTVTADTDATQIVVNNDMVYVAYSMRWIEIYDLDLQSTLLNRYLPINVTADSLVISSDTIFMTYRGISEGRVAAMFASTSVSSSFITLEQLQAPVFESVPVIYGADVVIGLSFGLAAAGALAIVGWALYFALRKSVKSFVKADSYVIMNEKHNK